jgi:hypothetical protein
MAALRKKYSIFRNRTRILSGVAPWNVKKIILEDAGNQSDSKNPPIYRALCKGKPKKTGQVIRGEVKWVSDSCNA